MAISCPLCCQSIDFDLLRMNLINIRNHPFICPICGDVQHSLDTLAAHLTQHIDRVPSQIGNNLQAMQCDVNNAIHSPIVETVNCAPICNDNNIVESSFKVEPNGNLIQNFDVSSSPLPPSSPPVSPLQSLNIAAEPSSSIVVRNDHVSQIAQPFVCNLCDGTFRSKDLQQMHMQLVHEINMCRSRENNNNSLKNARVNSSAITMQPCGWCAKRFKTIGSLRLHVRMVHGASHVPQIMCAPNTLACETPMSNNINLVPLSSLSTVGNDEKKLTETGDLAIASTSIAPAPANSLPLGHNNQSDYYHNYGLNDTTFGTNNNSSSSSSGDGSNAIDQIDTDKPYNGNNNNSKEMTITGTDDRNHKCDICNKCFTTKYFLKKHKRLHTGNIMKWNDYFHQLSFREKFVCKFLIGFFFSFGRTRACWCCLFLGEMPYACEQCNRTFTFQQSYHRHLSYHTNDRPHSCTICGHAFKELSTLHNHQRIHSGEKPFECESCGKQIGIRQIHKS